MASLVLRRAEPYGHRPLLPTGKRNSQNVAWVRKSLGYEDRLGSPWEPGDADSQQLMEAAVPNWLVVKPYRARGSGSQERVAHEDASSSCITPGYVLYCQE